MSIEAQLTVADGGSSRPLDVADWATGSTGAATQASLAAFLAANHTDLAALLTQLQALVAKIIAAPSTEAKQDAANTLLTTLAGKDFATQTTAAAILAKLSSDPSTATAQASANTKLDTVHTDLAALLAKVIATPATEAKQDSLISANHTDLAAILAKNEQLRLLLAGTLSVESSGAPTVTAMNYNPDGTIASYTERREPDGKTRTVTRTYTGNNWTQLVGAWA